MITQLSSYISFLDPKDLSDRAVFSPYDGTEVGEFELPGRTNAKLMLKKAKEVWAAGATPTLPERIQLLRKVADRIEAEKEDLAFLIAREGGKPLTDALVEVSRAAQTTRYAAEEAMRLHGVEVPMTGTPSALGRLAFTTREPIGVVLAISAFNHPLNLIAHQVAPAVAVGCPVLAKPDLRTPLSCFQYLEMLYEAGLPVECALPVPCENEVAEELATSSDIAYLSFIGSARVGWYLRSRLAPGVRCALEHGGAAPVIVDETADLGAAVPLLLKGGFYHAGQVCVSVQRVFAHTAVFAELLERLAAGARSLRVGDPTSKDTHVGPLILPREVERVHEWIEEALQGGAQLVSGGRPLPNQCYEPTILANPPLESRVMTEEVFGPVLSVVEFADLSEAIAMSNATRWSFQAAIFTRKLHAALATARNLHASAVMINDHAAFRVDWMPFGGRGESGLGLGGVPYTIRELTQEKLIVFQES